MTVPSRSRSLLRRGILAAAAALCVAGSAAANPVPESEQVDRVEPLPERLRGIDVQEHLGAQVNESATFVDETGHEGTLRDYMDGKHPVILTLNYSKCPMLCSLELNGLVTALKQIDWTLGDEFKIVTVVLDPHEKPEDAAKSKARYLGQYGRQVNASAWHFLTGTDESIHRVASSVGFKYGFNEARNEYVHPASIILLSPNGKISRYLYGIEYHPRTVRLSLAEVAEGKVGSSVDQLVLYCFHYDEKEGRYAPIAMNIMRVTSGIGATLLGGVLGSFWLAETRRKKKNGSPDTGSGRSS